MRVRISEIAIGQRKRRLDEATVDRLMDSIRIHGLLHPITVTKKKTGYRLVAGWHRLEACRRLDHQEMAVVMVDGPELQLELAEIDENLTRAELSPIQRADCHARREDILKTLDILERVSGTRPIGWISPDLRPGDRTLEILAEAGIQWNGDFPNDDLPYVVQVNGSPMVIIPYGNQTDDRELYQRHRQLPSTLADNFSDALDVLYEEGATHPKMLNVSLRAHLFGRANGKMAIDRTIRYAKSLPPPGVWITTRTEIAEWWRQRGYS